MANKLKKTESLLWKTEWKLEKKKKQECHSRHAFRVGKDANQGATDVPEADKHRVGGCNQSTKRNNYHLKSSESQVE